MKPSLLAFHRHREPLDLPVTVEASAPKKALDALTHSWLQCVAADHDAFHPDGIDAGSHCALGESGDGGTIARDPFHARSSNCRHVGRRALARDVIAGQIELLPETVVSPEGGLARVTRDDRTSPKHRSGSSRETPAAFLTRTSSVAC